MSGVFGRLWPPIAHRIVFLGAPEVLENLRGDTGLFRRVQFANHPLNLPLATPVMDWWLDHTGSEVVLCHRIPRRFAGLLAATMGPGFRRLDWAHQVRRFPIALSSSGLEADLDVRVHPVLVVRPTPESAELANLERDLEALMKRPSRSVGRIAVAYADALSQTRLPIKPIDALDAWDLAQTGVDFAWPETAGTLDPEVWRRLNRRLDSRWANRIADFSRRMELRNRPVRFFPLDLSERAGTDRALNLVIVLRWLINGDANA